MADPNDPITLKVAFKLTSIGINPQFSTFTNTNVTMESDKFICVSETSPQNCVVIIDMSMPLQQPLRMPITADSALMNPISKILALKAQLPGTTQDNLLIHNIETKAKIKSHQMPEQVFFWKWITPKMLGMVTQTSVYHWSIEGDSEPVKMFDRAVSLLNNQIIDYKCDPSEKWLVLIGISTRSPESVKGNMHLFSVENRRSQVFEAHAASFTSLQVPGNDNPSIIISFATKSCNAGQVTLKLRVIELAAAQPGKPSIFNKQADLRFPPDFEDDFPVAMQISQKYSLIYVITNLGLLFVYDLKTATEVYSTKISSVPILLTSEAFSVGGFYAVDTCGVVSLATVNESTIVSFVSRKLEFAAKLGNPSGAEDLVERFQELFAETKYKEEAKFEVVPLTFPTIICDVRFYGDSILTTVTSKTELVNDWVTQAEFLLNQSKKKKIIGLGIEWKPYLNSNPAATLQLCVEDKCLIFQILLADGTPTSLKRFLSNQNYTFVGVGIAADVEKLQTNYGLNVPSIKDLATLAYDVDERVKNYATKKEIKPRNIGIKTLSLMLLGKHMNKDAKDTLTNWEEEHLTFRQVVHASLDAFVSYEIGKFLL